MINRFSTTGLSPFLFLAFGFNEFAARLPSALLGTGCVIMVFLLGRSMFGPMAGLLSGVILATSGEQVISLQDRRP